MSPEQAMSLLKRRRLSVLLAYAVVALLGVGSAALFFVDRRLVIVTAAALVLFYLLVAARADRAYAGLFVRLNLLVSAAAELPDASAQSRRSIPREELDAAGLFPLPPGKKCALTKGCLKNGFASAAEIFTFYEVPRSESRHGVRLLHGLLFEVKATGGKLPDLAYAEDGILPRETQEELYRAHGLTGSAVQLRGERPARFYLPAGLPQPEADAARRQLRRLLDALGEKSGRVILRMKDDTVYLFCHERSLEMNVPVVSAPPRSALESDRIPELGVLLKTFRP